MPREKVSDTLDVHTLSGMQLKGLWALEKLSNDSKDRFSGTEVVNYLVETCGVNTSLQAIKYALEKDRAVVHKNKAGYKLMEPGRKRLAELISDRVIVVESGKPFSAKNVILRDIFKTLTSPIFICDPYLDINTLDLLFKNVDKKHIVKVLTDKIADKPTGSFKSHLEELRREGFQIEIGVCSTSDLHDRYMMDGHSFWLSGNSFNHLGNKESFLILLGEDIRQNMLISFNTRWKTATQI
jgi:hypothetical protein